MINQLTSILQSNPNKGYLIIFNLVSIFLFMLWVSIIDIMKKSVTFWKILLASSTVIVMPFIYSLFCGCKYLKWFLIGAFILWIFFLFLNIKFNNERFIGKADLDFLSAIFAEGIAVSLWLFYIDPNYAAIKVTQFWYISFLYLLIGSLILVFILILAVILRLIIGKNKNLRSFKGVKISILPMFIPVSIMVPFNIMIM